MSRRRKQLLAAAVGALVLVVVLVAVLAGGGSSDSSHSISVPAAQIPAGTTDPHAQDRRQITAVALAYEQAIEANTDPCSYLDPQSRVFAMAQVKRQLLGAHPCAAVAEQMSGTPPVEGVSSAGIVFASPSQQVDCSGDGTGPDHGLPTSQQGFRWATAAWAGGAGAQVTFVYEKQRWWVDVLICPGASTFR